MAGGMKTIVLVATMAAAVAASYGLAIAREPQSLWLWRDVLGVIKG